VSLDRPNLPLRLVLIPHLAAALPAQAARLGLTVSTLLAILAWNDHVRPAPVLPRPAAHPKLSRSAISCSLRQPIRRIAAASARSRRLSLNGYLEALVDAYLRRRSAHLTILARDEPLTSTPPR
jgi:hypothetical protein